MPISEEKEEINKINKFRNICLDNAEDLLKAALLLLENKIDHASFHMSVMALEEIGKSHLATLSLMAKQDPRKKENTPNFDTDDHEKKLFFAIWGPSFGRTKMTMDQIRQSQSLSKNLHGRRLFYLYSDADSLLSWKEKIEVGEAKMIYDFVLVRLKLERSSTGDMRTDDIPPEEQVELTWFLNQHDDPDRRKEIWGHKSQDKLIELGDVKKWIRWLKETYDTNDAQMKALLQEELERGRPSDDEARKPKWRVKVRVVTPSHSIRKKDLNSINIQSTALKLRFVDNNTLLLELNFPKALPVSALWDHGWDISRMFIVAMNIATRGLFWWNVRIDPSRYYEEIWDVENNAGVRLEINPRLQINWRDFRWVFGKTEIGLSFFVFNFLTEKWPPGSHGYFEDYATALSALAKNDIHLRLEVSSFEFFFKSLRQAMIENGAWDSKSDFADAYQKQVSFNFPVVTDDMKKFFRLGFEVEKDHNPSSPITLTEVIGMKSYCDTYFLKLAKENYEKKSGQKLEFVMSNSKTEEDKTVTQ